MNATERFFRRYIFSSIGIVVLFLTVNVLLVGSYLAVAYLENVADFTVDVLNEGICFFLFHQPPFPENARKMKEHKEEEENGKNSRFTN